MKKLIILWLSVLAIAVPAHSMEKALSTLQKQIKKHPKTYGTLAIASGVGGFIGYEALHHLGKKQRLSPQEIVAASIFVASHTKESRDIIKSVMIMLPYIEFKQDNEHEKMLNKITSYNMSDIPEELLKQIAEDKNLQYKIFKFYSLNKNHAKPSPLSKTQKELWQKIFAQHTLEELYEATYFQAKTEHLVRTIAPEFVDSSIKINELWKIIYDQRTALLIEPEETSSIYHRLAKKHGVTIPSWVTIKFEKELQSSSQDSALDIHAETNGLTIHVNDNAFQQTALLAGTLGHEYGHIKLGHYLLINTAATLLSNTQTNEASHKKQHNARFKNLNHHIELSADIYMCLMSTQGCSALIENFKKVDNKARLNLIDALVTQQNISRKKASYLVNHPQTKDILIKFEESDTHPAYITRIENMEKVQQEKKMIERYGCKLNVLHKDLGMPKWFDCTSSSSSQEPFFKRLW